MRYTWERVLYGLLTVAEGCAIVLLLGKWWPMWGMRFLVWCAGRTALARKKGGKE